MQLIYFGPAGSLQSSPLSRRSSSTLASPRRESSSALSPSVAADENAPAARSSSVDEHALPADPPPLPPPPPPQAVEPPMEPVREEPEALVAAQATLESLEKQLADLRTWHALTEARSAVTARAVAETWRHLPPHLSSPRSEPAAECLSLNAVEPVHLNSGVFLSSPRTT